MDLQVAPVEPIVVEDHDRGELDVLVVERLHRAVERADDEVERAERLRLERVQLLLEVLPGAGQPNLPVTYSSVRESCGEVKMRCVGPNSTSSPLSMNAVSSATRAACCMLCVTMTIV